MTGIPDSRTRNTKALAKQLDNEGHALGPVLCALSELIRAAEEFEKVRRLPDVWVSTPHYRKCLEDLTAYRDQLWETASFVERKWVNPTAQEQA